jgi:short-subunit dehydrogenase
MQDFPGYVVVTGASGGIGFELARLFALDQHNLIIVGSNNERLLKAKDKLMSESRVDIITICKDLSKLGAAQELFDEITARKLPIAYLINNAGFGLVGPSEAIDFQKDESLLLLNVVFLTELSKLFLGYFYSFKRGGILNVASTAAFTPGPYSSTYFASKSYVLSYSKAIHYEAKKKNKHIAVSCLCPGPTKTQFFVKESIKTPSWSMDASKVALLGYKGLLKNKAVIIPGFINKLSTHVGDSLSMPYIAKMKD